MTWRDSCRFKIAKVITDTGTSDIKKLRRALREAYPFGERKYWPYKVWCSEIRNQIHFTLRSNKIAELPLFKKSR